MKASGTGVSSCLQSTQHLTFLISVLFKLYFSLHIEQEIISNERLNMFSASNLVEVDED